MHRLSNLARDRVLLLAVLTQLNYQLYVQLLKKISLKYMLRCLHANIPTDSSCSTKVFGHNLAVVKSASNPAADISKKHVAISFHSACEAIAACILELYWIAGQFNIPDICIKQIAKTLFCDRCDFLFWRPNFHFRDHNRLDMNYEE